MTEHAGQPRYSFGEFTLDLERGALSNGGKGVHLRPKSFEVLRYLVQHPGRLVGKQELMDAVWGRTVVTEGSLTQCIVDIRRAVGDERQRLLRTVPRRGFIFEVPVEQLSAHATATPAPGLPGAHDAPVHAGPVHLEPRAEPVRPRRLRLALVILALIVAIAAGSRLGTLRTDVPATADATTPAIPAKSVAVLRFMDLSPEGDQAWFADGLAEELLNLLAQSPELRVTARASSFAFDPASADIASIARELGVGHVIEGSVRRDGDALRVTVQLIDARTQAHVWSRSYDRTPARVLEVQSEIAADVAAVLAATLEPRPVSTSPQAAAAQESYLLGRHLFQRRSPGDLAAAERHFERAVQLDPRHARAWTALAGVYGVRGYDELQDPSYRLEEQRLALERALAIDPGLGEALVRLGRYYSSKGDSAAARAAFDRARQVAPDSPLVIYQLAHRAVIDGRFDEAIELVRRNLALDPLSAMARMGLAELLAAAGRHEAALAELRRAAALAPGQRDVTANVARELYVLGRHDEARELIADAPQAPVIDQSKVLLADPAEAGEAYERLRAVDTAESHFLLAEIAAQQGDLDAAYESLAAAQRIVTAAGPLANFPLAYETMTSTLLGPLRADPRWEDLRADMGRR